LPDRSTHARAKWDPGVGQQQNRDFNAWPKSYDSIAQGQGIGVIHVTVFIIVLLLGNCLNHIAPICEKLQIWVIVALMGSRAFCSKASLRKFERL
jgi:hypothetical protein